jgi:pimeloyl-ACP methyl ester carboxylesterase
MAQGKQDKVPKAQSPKEVEVGAKAWLMTKTKRQAVYFLRVPKSYDAKKGARMIVFLHGSNMSGYSYLITIEKMGWCTEDLLVCPNGEKGGDPFGANNFSFGSAPFVADVVKEVAAAFKVRRTYLGGHSQGGFVTYSTIMLYPELFQGAFPMAGDCWMQNEPNLWQDEPKKMARQMQIAIAIIHGKADPVVDISQGRHAYNIFNVMGYPMLKLFAPEKLGHQFALSPVPEALAWLDALKGDDCDLAVTLAEKWAKEKDWAGAVGAARNVMKWKKATSKLKSRAKSVLSKAEKAAKPVKKAMAKAMAKEPALTWLPRWFDFRRRFGRTKAAAGLVKRYCILREKQRKEGEKLFNKAYSLWRSGYKEKSYATFEELLKTAPCTYEAYYAVDWLKGRDKKKD